MSNCLDCGNALHRDDGKRNPASLLHCQEGSQGMLYFIRSMRLRCQSCYSKNWCEKYTAFSYKTDFHPEGDGKENTRTINRQTRLEMTFRDDYGDGIHDYVQVPTRDANILKQIVSPGLYFLDALNAETTGTVEWTRSFVKEIYGDAAEVLAVHHPKLGDSADASDWCRDEQLQAARRGVPIRKDW